MKTKNTIYQKKARWVRAVRAIDQRTREFIRSAKLGSRQVSVGDVLELGERIRDLGSRGEDLWQAYVDHRLGASSCYSIADKLDLLEQLSALLGKVGADLLGMEIHSYRHYVNERVYPTGEIE